MTQPTLHGMIYMTSAPERLAMFYKTLGFEVRETFHEEHGFLYDLRLKETTIHIREQELPDSIPVMYKDNDWTILGFYDLMTLRAAYSRLLDEGFVQDIQKSKINSDLVITDPDGRLIQLVISLTLSEQVAAGKIVQKGR